MMRTVTHVSSFLSKKQTMMKTEFVSPEKLLLMTVEEYLNTYGGKTYSERGRFILYTRLNRSADKLRRGIIGGKPKSNDGEPLLVWDLVRISCARLREIRIGMASIQYISDALECNELRMNMYENDLAQYIENFDATIVKLRQALEGVCQQCIREKKKDFSRIFDKQKTIVPGFECYVLVTKV